MIYALLIFSLSIILYGHLRGATIAFSPIIGVMVGGLYSYTDYEDAREHTLQCCILILAITVVWETSNG